MDKLLLLHKRYTSDDGDIWREAISRGWRTARVGIHPVDIERNLLPRPDLVRYYGNTLHYDAAKDHFPIIAAEIPAANLASMPDLTKRRIELITVADVKQPITHSQFLKCPYTKWITARVYQPGECLENIMQTDQLYRQEIISFDYEIRCFVIEGRIVTASYYRNHDKNFEPKELFDIPNEVREIAAEAFRRFIWPKGVVFDFCRLTDGSWAFLEANECWASGLYYCDPSGCFDTIIESQSSRN